MSDHWRKALAADIFLAHNVKYLSPKCRDTAVLFCFFNPTNSLKLKENFAVVSRKLNDAQIPNFSIELCIGEQTPVTRADFVVYSPTPLFYKESLWNNLSQRVPEQYTKLIFIDADVLFLAPDWVDQCSAILDQADVMQPMVTCRRIGSIETRARAAYLTNQTEVKKYGGHPGFAVGVRREWFSRVLFHEGLMGGGDGIFWAVVAIAQSGMLAAEVAKAKNKSVLFNQSVLANSYAEGKEKNLLEYTRAMCQTPPRVGCAFNVQALHLPHGSLTTRRYSRRYTAFSAQDFLNVAQTDCGLPYWPPDSEPAKKAIAYFDSRHEDGHPYIAGRIQQALQQVRREDVPIFCITLKRAAERQAQMRQEWVDRLGLPLTFFYGADKRDICRQKTAQQDGGVLPYRDAEARRFIKRPLNCGERACRLSHFLCARKLLRDYPDAPIYVMLEDDVRPLCRDKNEFFDRLICGFYEQQGIDALIIHNITNPVKMLHSFRLFSCRMQLMPRYPAWVGTPGLAFSRQGLEQYCEQLQYSFPADAWHFWPNTFKVACLVNNLVEHRGDTTYIGNQPHKRTVLE